MIMRGYLIIIILGTCFAVSAQEKKTDNFPPPDIQLEVKVSKAQGRIDLDGNLNEADWQNSEVLNDFFRREPR